MKVAAFNGSPRSHGNTYDAIMIVLNELQKEGIETEIIHVGNKNIRGCIACNKCKKNKDEKCAQTGDDVNEWIQKMKEADGIILGTPTHFSSVAGTMTSFLDRAFYVASSNNGLFRHKTGASVVTVRRSGGMPTLDQLNRYILYSEMFMPSSNYWNVIHGAIPGEALQDEEGTQIMKVLGRNMAMLMKSLDVAKGVIKAPEKEVKVFTNFIR